MASTTLKRMAKRGAGAFGLPSQSDPYCDVYFNKVAPNQPPHIVEGVVARAGSGLYDVEVCVYGPLKYTCNVLVPCGSNTFGYSTAALPIEGARVLVLIPDITSKKGYILGTLPPYDGSTQRKAPGTEDNPLYTKRSYPDDLTGLGFAFVYDSIPMDEEYVSKLLCNSLRPVDVVPGEYTIQNENDCGVYLAMFSASITGGMAYIQACRFDDTVRISCRTFQKYSSTGSELSYNDNGYIDTEEKVSIYQGERVGFPSLVEQPYNKNEENEDKNIYYLQNKKKLQTAKARIKKFVGFVGNLINKFILRPDDSIVPLTRDSKPKDTGVQQLSVDGSGTTRIRSAGGISLERYDRIPVPHRTNEAFDPEGDNEINPTGLKPFEWDSEQKYRPVQLTDAIAWDHGQEYKRFDEHKKDFYTPEESDLKTPEDAYDKGITSSSPQKLEESDKKRCGLFLGTDGSIIIRDNWGSEIVMSGGDVTITAAEDLKIISPKNIAILGKNVALDADSGIDMAAESVFQYAEEDFFIAGRGVLLHSFSSSPVWSNHKSGSATNANGITLLAPDSSVATYTDYAHIHGNTKVGIVTGKEEDERSGTVSISTDTTYIRGTSYLVNDDSLITNSGNTIFMYGQAANTAVADNWSVIKGDQMLVPTWGDLEESPIPDLSTQANALYEQLTDYAWFSPILLEDLKERIYTFRSSIQEDTTEIVFIQPAWNTTWSYDTSKTYDNYSPWDPFVMKGAPTPYLKSWPGNSTLGKNKYITLDPKNVNNGISKGRKELVPSSNPEKKIVSQYPRI